MKLQISKPSIIYPVTISDGMLWYRGDKEEPLPVGLDGQSPFLIYIRQLYKKDLTGALVVSALMMQQPGYRGYIWESQNYVVEKWSRGDTCAMSIYTGKNGKRWFGIANEASRFARVCRYTLYKTQMRMVKVELE